MSFSNPANWDNYWQGRNSTQSGNALVEVGIEKNHALKNFWIETFSNHDRTINIIDLACGAGSVLEHAHNLGFANLTGLDVSAEALKVLKDKIPTATQICAQVDAIPRPDNSYDMIVSQYGIEYAGSRDMLFKAFKEMDRVLKPGGDITIIAHAENGIIYQGCMNSLRNVERIEKSGFLNIVEAIISLMHRGDQSQADGKVKKELIKLNEAADPIMEWLSTSGLEQDEFARFSYHVLQSSHTLITKHHAYSKDDSLTWISGIRSEIQAYKGRMTSMTDAALSREQIEQLITDLSADAKTLKFSPPEEFYFETGQKPAAWIIRAQKN